MATSANGNSKPRQGLERAAAGKQPRSFAAPRFVSIRFLDTEGNRLPSIGEFVQLEDQTVVEVRLNRAATHAFFFLTPTGTETFELSRLIGIETVNRQRIIQFRWDVPPATLGHLFIVACNHTACRQSRSIGVFHPETPNEEERQ